MGQKASICNSFFLWPINLSLESNIGPYLFFPLLLCDFVIVCFICDEKLNLRQVDNVRWKGKLRDQDLGKFYIYIYVYVNS